MIYCHTYANWKHAKEHFESFVESHVEELVKVSRINYMTLDQNGDIHYFMPFSKYWEGWYLGREYMWQGKFYRSGSRADMRGEE